MSIYNTYYSNDKFGGTLITGNRNVAEVELKQIDNVTNLEYNNNYLLTIKHKLSVINTTMYRPSGENVYRDYPAIITCFMKPYVSSANVNFIPLSVSPKALSSSTNHQIKYDYQNTENQYIEGSSYFDINTHHYTTNTNKRLDSSISDLSSMSIKDWSAYAEINGECVTWTFAQKYPVDFLKFNSKDFNGNLILPENIKKRLNPSGDIVLPPSDLSLFGIDTIVEGIWLISTPNPQIISDFKIGYDARIDVYNASHGISSKSKKLEVTQRSNQYYSIGGLGQNSLNLTQYSLDPITSMTYINIPKGNFLYKPTKQNPNKANNKSSTPSTENDTTQFKIISREKDLQVVGNNFYSDLTPMYMPYYDTNNTNNNDQGNTSSLEISFKISDLTKEYNLHLIHWLNSTSSANCVLSITINNTPLTTKTVKNVEGKGGQNNTDSFYLRNLDFTSQEFNDYLNLGMNTIYITFYSDNKEATPDYTLYSLALG